MVGGGREESGNQKKGKDGKKRKDVERKMGGCIEEKQWKREKKVVRE